MKTSSVKLAFVLVVGFAVLLGCQDTTPAPGSISGTCYSSSIAAPASTFLATQTDPASAIVVSPAIGGKTLFLTDNLGNFSIPDVPVGTYSVAPVLFPEDAATVEVTAGADSATDLRYAMPMSMQCLYFNLADATVPLNDKDVRQAFSLALDHAAVATSVGTAIGATRAPLQSFIPIMSLQTSPLSSMNLFAYNTTTATSLLASKTLAGFGVLVNASGGEQDAFGAAVATPLSSISGTTVTSSPVSDRPTQLQNKTFIAARVGWTLYNTNEMARLFEQWVLSTSTSNFSGINNATLDGLIGQAKTARDAGDAAAYVARIVDINNLLIVEVPMIPLYYIAP